jgi:hypothetical protein
MIEGHNHGKKELILSKSSSSAAFTVKAFGIYALITGLNLIFAPNMLLNLFGIPATSEVWIRVVGVLAFNIGIYYWYAAKCEAKAFFEATVYVRCFVFIAFALFVTMGLVHKALILFGCVEVVGAIWTWLALRRKK